MDPRICRADYQVPPPCDIDIRTLATFAPNVVHSDSRHTTTIHFLRPRATVTVRPTGLLHVFGGGTEEHTQRAIEKVFALIAKIPGHASYEYDPSLLRVLMVRASESIGHNGKFPLEKYCGKAQYRPYEFIVEKKAVMGRDAETALYGHTAIRHDELKDLIAASPTHLTVPVQPYGVMSLDDTHPVLIIRLVGPSAAAPYGVCGVAANVYASGAVHWSGGSVQALRDAHAYLRPILMNAK